MADGALTLARPVQDDRGRWWSWFPGYGGLRVTVRQVWEATYELPTGNRWPGRTLRDETWEGMWRRVRTAQGTALARLEQLGDPPGDWWGQTHNGEP